MFVFVENATANEDVPDPTVHLWTRDSAKITVTSEVYVVWESVSVTLDTKVSPAKRSQRVPRVVPTICRAVEQMAFATWDVAFADRRIPDRHVNPQILVQELKTDESVEEMVCVMTASATVRRDGTVLLVSEVASVSMSAVETAYVSTESVCVISVGPVPHAPHPSHVRWESIPRRPPLPRFLRLLRVQRESTPTSRNTAET